MNTVRLEIIFDDGELLILNGLSFDFYDRFKTAIQQGRPGRLESVITFDTGNGELLIPWAKVKYCRATITEPVANEVIVETAPEAVPLQEPLQTP